MARKKAPELSPEAQAANAEGEARREKEKQSRLKNAEKQKRFRESRKSDGYRRVTLWDDPALSGKPGRMAGMGYRQVPAWEMPLEHTDKGRAAKIRLAVRIRESSLHAGARLPQVQKALAIMIGTVSELSPVDRNAEKKADGIVYIKDNGGSLTNRE